MTWLLIANAASTFFMAGLIWFVQVVHYPLFAAVGDSEFPAYSRLHQSLTTLVVGPPMLVEALTAGMLVVARPSGVSAWLAWTGFAIVIVIWASTALLQIPAHGRLASGFDASTAATLVSSNWIRTIAWSARAAIVAAMLWQVLSARSGAGAP
jgi:hypothetical protein